VRGPSVKTASWTAGADHSVLLPGGRSLALTGSPQYQEAGGDAAQRAAASWSVATEEEFYAAGQTPTLALTYRNPDGRRHRVQLLAAATVPGDAPRSVRGGSDAASPGETLRRTLPLPALSRAPVRVRVSLTLDGVRQSYSQEVAFTPTDPVGLSVAPLTGAAVLVHLANPAGTAFTGRLALAPGAATSRPVHLAAGQAGLDVTLPSPNLGAECVLRDARGHTVTRLPATRFAPYTAALSSFRAVLDGDTKLPSTVHLDGAPAPPGGGPALLLDYKFAPGWSFARVAEGRPAALTGKPLGLGLWIYGDAGGNLARLRFRDASGQTFQAGGLPIDWQGWRFVAFPLVPLPGEAAVSHWGGDGQVHYPVSVDTLFLLDSIAGASRHAGKLWIKQPTVIYGSAK